MLVLVLDTQVALAPVPHGWKLLSQFTPHVVPLQTGPPLAGSAQAVQPVAVHPDATLLFATHVVGIAVGQPWNPAAQVTLQVVPLQTDGRVGGRGARGAAVGRAARSDAVVGDAGGVAPVPHR